MVSKQNNALAIVLVKGDPIQKYKHIHLLRLTVLSFCWCFLVIQLMNTANTFHYLKNCEDNKDITTWRYRYIRAVPKTQGIGDTKSDKYDYALNKRVSIPFIASVHLNESSDWIGDAPGIIDSLLRKSDLHYYA
jgi:hypothetical protein